MTAYNGEIGPLDLSGRIFTMILGVVSVGIGGYVVSTFAALIVEGDFQRLLQSSKMDKLINELNDHIVLCGAGGVGLEIAIEFYRRNPCVRARLASGLDCW